MTHRDIPKKKNPNITTRQFLNFVEKLVKKKNRQIDANPLNRISIYEVSHKYNEIKSKLPCF